MEFVFQVPDQGWWKDVMATAVASVAVGSKGCHLKDQDRWYKADSMIAQITIHRWKIENDVRTNLMIEFIGQARELISRDPSIFLTATRIGSSTECVHDLG